MVSKILYHARDIYPMGPVSIVKITLLSALNILEVQSSLKIFKIAEKYTL